MKLLIIGLGLALCAVNAQAKSLDAYCMISIQEKVKKEIVKIDKLIEFKCDNYGADATVESPSKRFMVTAFWKNPALLNCSSRSQIENTFYDDSDGKRRSR